MPHFVIERNVPGLGSLKQADLSAMTAKSNGVLADLGPEVQWVHSYVTDDKMYCVYRAPSDVLVKEHARRGGFPADSVKRVHTVIDPTTAE